MATSTISTTRASQFVISVIALITIRWIHANFSPAVSQDGPLAGVIIVLTGFGALMLAALVAFLVVEAFSELDKDQQSQTQPGAHAKPRRAASDSQRSKSS